MPNRILKESICTSETINGLSVEAERFFYRLIVQCDDYGRFDGRISVLIARCFPLRIDTVKPEHIETWLAELTKNRDNGEPLVTLYVAEGKPYLQITKWDKHQQIRAQRSKYPTSDSNGNQPQANDSTCPRIRNPIQSESEPGVSPLAEFINEYVIQCPKSLWSKPKMYQQLRDHVENALARGATIEGLRVALKREIAANNRAPTPWELAKVAEPDRQKPKERVSRV